MMKKSSKSAKDHKDFKISPGKILLGSAVMVGVFWLYNVFSTVTIHFELGMFAEKVKIGEPFDISIDIKNTSDNELKNVELLVNLSNGLAFPDGTRTKIKRIPLGEVGRNGTHEELVKLLALPVESGNPEERKAEVIFNYSIGSLTARFRQEKTIPIVVEDDSYYNLRFDHPNRIVSGEQFDTIVSYEYGGGEQSERLKIQIDYPSLFRKISSNPKSSSLENVWELGTLPKGAKGKITLTGKAEMPDNSTLKMTAKILAKIGERDYVVASKDAEIAISPSPLGLRVFTEEKKDFLRPGETINYNLSYRNNTDEALKDVVIRAKLLGQFFDLSSLQVQGGVFDQATGTITWDKQSIAGLESLEPGTIGSVVFSIRLAENYPIKKFSDKNFTAKVEARIESPTVPSPIIADKLVNTSVLENKIVGKIEVRPSIYFRDAESLILNKGVLPPKVGSSTEFTVHWVVYNYWSNTSNIEIRARLPEGVEFTNVTKSSTDRKPFFESDKNEVVWQIDRMLATTGFTGKPLEAVFQIRFTPKENHVGSYVPLVGDTIVKAVDDFIGSEINTSTMALTTRLESDKSVREQEGIVMR